MVNERSVFESLKFYCISNLLMFLVITRHYDSGYIIKHVLNGKKAVDGFTTRRRSSVTFSLVFPFSVESKNLLLEEQILCFKSKSYFGRASSIGQTFVKLTNT